MIIVTFLDVTFISFTNLSNVLRQVSVNGLILNDICYINWWNLSSVGSILL